MRGLRTIYLAILLIVTATTVLARDAAKPTQPSSEQTPSDTTNEKWMIEGQKRFLTNCGRCHQSPHLFSPREMSMAVRHMRVRAMLSQEDMDYVLYFITHQ
jgi:cytochrome c5